MASNTTNDIENLCSLFNEKSTLTTNGVDQQKRKNVPQLNISTLSHYFSLQCGEFLRLSLTNNKGKKETEHSRSSLTKERGINFEKKLKEFYASSILHEIQDEDEFLPYLRSSIGQHDQTRIGYNIQFQWSYDQHSTSHYRPDFLLINHVRTDRDRIEITIADAKSSLRMSIEHCVQVALYAMNLRVWIERHRLDQDVFISNFGQIWLPSENDQIPHETNIFPMEKLQMRLAYFLRHDLDRVLQDSEWMTLPRCAFCSFSSICRQRVRQDQSDSMNNLAYLTPSTHSLLKSIVPSSCSSLRSIDLQRLFASSSDSTKSLVNNDKKVKLQKFFAWDKHNHSSSTLEALRTQKPQFKVQSSPFIPTENRNLRLLFCTLISNPSRLHSVALFAYNIYHVHDQSWFHPQAQVHAYPTSFDLISSIAQALEELRSTSPSPCQIVLFDEQERNTLFEQLTLGSDHPQIAQCLILLNASENAVLINPPPDIAQNDQIFRSHASTNEAQQEARKLLVGLPYLICLHSVIRQSFVVPSPGYFDLEDLKSSFQIDLPSPSIDQLLDSIQLSRMTDVSTVRTLAQERLDVLAHLYSSVQKNFVQSHCFQLDAYPLPQIHRIKNKDPHIRRLIVLRQFEMLHALRSFQQARFDAGEPPVLIRVLNKIPEDQYHTLWESQIEYGHDFISKNSSENPANAKDFRSYPYLIFQESSAILTFPDALYMDTAVEYSRSRTRFDHYGFAHVEQDEDDSKIFIRTKFCNRPLQVGQCYGLSERYIDFNTKKAIQALEEATPLTIDILHDPRRLEKPRAIQETKKEFQQEISNMFSKREPSIRPEGLHRLNRGQQEACEQVKNERLTLVWGPPGTGKTYWSGVTVFQMVMFSASPLRILITACTHAAIDNLLSSIDHIKSLFVKSPQFPRWHQLAKDLTLLKLDSKNLRQVSSSKTHGSMIVGSTVWKLEKLPDSVMFDVIFVDEATQLLTSDAVLALNRLAMHRESRLIVAGDPLQLPPIKRCQYPPLPDPIPDLFSSLFHCLLRDQDNRPIPLDSEKPFEDISRCPYLSIFNENHRMNEQLSDFTRLLYGESYRQGRAKPLLSIRPGNPDATYLLGPLLDPYSSLYTILIDSPPSSTMTRSEDVQLESTLVLSLVEELRDRIHPSSIFLITPHRLQRAVIRQKLSTQSFGNISITCDTVERMQGKEAQCVILCMLYRQRDLLEAELDFIFNRHRINVSITRAQQLCILLTSTLLIDQPPLPLFVNAATRNAYTLLSNYYHKSTVRSLDSLGSIKESS